MKTSNKVRKAALRQYPRKLAKLRSLVRKGTKNHEAVRETAEEVLGLLQLLFPVAQKCKGVDDVEAIGMRVRGGLGFCLECDNPPLPPNNILCKECLTKFHGGYSSACTRK